MTSPGDIYQRPFGDHVMILKVKAYHNGVYQFRWLELENGRYGTYTNPFGNDLGSVHGGESFLKVA